MLLLLIAVTGGSMFGQGNAPVDTPRPIPARQSLWTEELTWMEVRDAIKAGNTSILIGTGGVEQNGPYVAGGNLQVRGDARALGDGIAAALARQWDTAALTRRFSRDWRSVAADTLRACEDARSSSRAQAH